MAESNVYPCPHCPRTFSTQNGLAGHLGGAHRKSKSPLHPTRKTIAKPHRTGSFKCPECPRVFKYPNALGKHRSLEHGVPGNSASAISLRNKQQNAQPVSLESPHAPTHKRQATAENGHAPSLDPIVFALAVGELKEHCRHIAEEHDLPARLFTRQVAELFRRQTLR